MEIVTLAHVILNRVGSASQPGFVHHKELSAIRQLPDASAASLMEVVKTIAAETASRGTG